MLGFNEIIDFLLGLLQDEQARAEFEQDPEGTLARAGLDGITGEDVRDARLQLADSGGVSAVDDGAGSSYPDGNDPIREINYTTQHYRADETDTAQPDHGDDAPDVEVTDRSSTELTIDDRDSFFFQTFTSSDDDITIIDDSFNTGSNNVNSLNQDSLNQDNDVVAIQDNSTVNEDNDVTIDATGSFNSDDDVTAIQDNDTVVEDNDSLVVNADDSFNTGAAPGEPAPAAEETAIEDTADDTADDTALDDTAAADAAADAADADAAAEADAFDATADDADLDPAPDVLPV